MFSRRTDLPLDRDPAGRFLPWLIAFMVYLAVLAAAGVIALGEVVARWDSGVGGTLTVQVPAAEPDAGAAGLEAALAVLAATDGVSRAEPIADAAVRRLLEPWLGATASADDLPLPRLIDVEIDPGAGVDLEALGTRLAAAAPGTSVDDHRVWLDRLVRLIRTVEIVAAAVLVLIAACTVATVVFATRSGLAIHREAIEVLHLIGARDTYVARQFAGRALGLGIKGGAIGLALAVPTLIGLGHLVARLEGGLLPAVTVTLADAAVLAAVPVAVAAIAMLTARVTVVRTLARMP